MSGNVRAGRLPGRQGRALAGLLERGTVIGAADAAGMSERQVRRYLADANFVAELKVAEGEAIGSATRKLATLAGEACDVLGEIMRDPAPPPATARRIRAIDVILSNLLELRTMHDIEQRLSALERRLDERDSEKKA